MNAGGMWIATTRNKKTGDVPTLYVGESRAESLASCEGCGLLDSRDCYAQFGSPSFGHSSMVKAAARGKTYGFDKAMAGRKIGARMVRFGAIGDPSAIRHPLLRKWFDVVEGAGLRVVGYTHHWRRPVNAWLRDHFMASADNLAEADEAIDAGWRATAVVPSDYTGGTTPKGRKVLVCPAIAADRKGVKVTCNQCRMCHPSAGGTVIAFPDHGPKARARS